MARKPDRSLKPSGYQSADAESLKDFWRELVKGKFMVTDKETNALKEIPVPIEIRLRASELLAKYTQAMKANEVADEAMVTTTPDILRVAQMLEQKVTDEDIRKFFEQIDKGQPDG